MGGLVLLGLVAFVVAFILPIYLVISHSALKRRVAELERHSARLGNVPVQSSVEPAPKSQHEPWRPPEKTEAPKPEPKEKPDIPAVAASQDRPDDAVVRQTPEYTTPKAFVFTEGFIPKATVWLQKNWFFAIAAMSMALAGVFLVQYGVENGLLSPKHRVMAAILLGIVLIGAGEYIRRKLGSDEDGSFALLPSAFAGAGLITLFAGILSARMMYGLIEPGTAFIGLGLTGAIAVILGWYYGPLLAIVGVFGALSAPFLVGGDSSSAHLLQLYFAGIAAVALAIDSYKHWAWLSVLGLIGAYGAAWLLYVSGASGDSFNATFYVLFTLVAAGLALVLPERRLTPNHTGTRVLQMFTKTSESGYPGFPTRLAAGAFVASTAIIFSVYIFDYDVLWLSLLGLSALLLAAIFWMRGADALKDMAFLPPLAALGIIALEGLERGPVLRAWIDATNRDVLDYAPASLMILLAGAAITSLAFVWRSYQGGALKLVDTIYGASFAPLVAAIFAAFWYPEAVLGKANWALYLAAVAILMTVLSERFARKDGEDRVHTALFALSAMSMIAFMAFTILGSFALTLALAVLVTAAAWLGRKFNLPLMDRYVQLGILVVSWRLVLIPGVFWAFDGKLWQVILTFVGVITLLIAAYFVRRQNTRLGVMVMLESAIWSLTGVFFSVMLGRYFDNLPGNSEYLMVSLGGVIWLISSANQMYRIREGAGLRRTRITLASIYGLMGTGLTAVSVFGLNPLNGVFETPDITGPYILDSIAVAYALPGLLLGFVAWKFKHLPRRLRKFLAYWSVAMVLFYVGLEIRRFWHGNNISAYKNTLQGELYSYTIVMMLVSIILLVFAFMRQSALLRKLALVGVAATVAKVYLIDMSGLDGLLRVVSFLVLGLVLAAMAWVNRILQKNEENGEDQDRAKIE
ncbi:MAG: DUF2339 domain-containing protein [Paracoccaceae bacterium]